MVPMRVARSPRLWPLVDQQAMTSQLKQGVLDALNLASKARRLERLEDSERASGFVELLGLQGHDVTVAMLEKKVVRMSLRFHPDKIEPLLPPSLPSKQRKDALEAYKLLQGLYHAAKEILFPSEVPVITEVESLQVIVGEDPRDGPYLEITCLALEPQEVAADIAIMIDVPDPVRGPEDPVWLPLQEELPDEPSAYGIRLYEYEYSWLFVPAVNDEESFRLAVFKVRNGEAGPAQEILVHNSLQKVFKQDSQKCEPKLANQHPEGHVFEIMFEDDLDWEKADVQLPKNLRARLRFMALQETGNTQGRKRSLSAEGVLRGIKRGKYNFELVDGSGSMEVSPKDVQPLLTQKQAERLSAAGIFEASG
eukprot:s1550_g1.t1